jgi:hypothetical protein
VFSSAGFVQQCTRVHCCMATWVHVGNVSGIGTCCVGSQLLHLGACLGYAGRTAQCRGHPGAASCTAAVLPGLCGCWAAVWLGWGRLAARAGQLYCQHRCTPAAAGQCTACGVQLQGRCCTACIVLLRAAAVPQLLGSVLPVQCAGAERRYLSVLVQLASGCASPLVRVCSCWAAALQMAWCCMGVGWQIVPVF